MVGYLRIVAGLAAMLLGAGIAHATSVTIDTSPAKAMLAAIRDPALTLDQARAVATMTGNRGATRKLREFGIAASDESFAKAIYDTAHGNAISDPVEKSYLLDMVRDNQAVIAGIVQRIESDPSQFQAAIETRIAAFTPANSDIHLVGYVIAGGDGGGYAFGDTDFYLNLGIIHDFRLARSVTNHEMYHAVQGSFAAARGIRPGDPAGGFCASAQRLFEAVYEEGSAVYVEDQSLIEPSTDAISIRKKTDLAEGMRHLDWSASLLEMSIDALKAQPPLPYDDVYAVGFYGHGPLYVIGYRMVLDIVEQDGPQALQALLRQPSYRLILSYIHLPRYGLDTDHPRLHPGTIAAAQALAGGCR